MIDTEIDNIDWNSWVPEEEDTLVFIKNPQQVLLIHKKRGLGAGNMNGPGGKIDPGETAKACAIRETQEELLITPLDISKRAELRFQSNDFGKILCHVFVAARFSGVPTETDEAIPVWTDLDNLPFKQMWEDDVYWLPHVLYGKQLSGEFLFAGEKLLDYSLQLHRSSHRW